MLYLKQDRIWYLRMKKILKKVTLLTTIILLFCGCEKSNDELILVTEAGFAPYEYYENGEIVGVDIEIAKEIAKETGKKLVVKDIAFDSIINELNSGKADFAAAGMSITEERKKKVDFTIEYTTSNQVVIVKKDSNIKNIDEIKNKRISVQLGTVADQYVTKNYKDAQINRLKKFLIAAEDVKNNKSDCIVMDALPAKELVKKNPELKILDGVLFQDKYGMAVKKGNKELLNTINKVLTRLMEEEKIEQYIITFSE